jgi:hypothetical protein
MMTSIDAVDVIPPPPSVRRDLAVAYRGADLLRRLLRLSEQKQWQLSSAALHELNWDAERAGGGNHAS